MTNRATSEIPEEMADMLRAMETTYQHAKRTYEDSASARERLIRLAWSQGGAVRDIADILGVSHQLVARVVGRRNAQAA